MLSHHLLATLLHRYGYGGIGVVIMLESIGMPLPGESLMLAAAIYAAATNELDIVAVVLVASAGAIAGGEIGFLLGRSIGLRLLTRFGRRIGLTPQRLRLGQFLFRRHGGKVVFFGRFIVVLRTLAALLAGAIGMDWRSFLLFNVLGGFAWCSLYGFGAYLLGDAARHLSGPIGIVIGVIGTAAIISVVIFLKRNEKRLQADAEREMAGQPDLA